MTHTTTTSDGIAAQILQMLTGTTGAGTNVFGPRDWPTTLGDMPIILVQTPSERKQSQGNGGINFNVTMTVRVVARVTSPAATGDTGCLACLAALGTLQRQIEVAVITANPTLPVSQISSVEIQNQVTSNAHQHVGELTMDFTLEFYQGYEDFGPPTVNPLQEMAVYTDLVNVFSPTGTFTQNPFPGSINPSPRTSGPDGRLEGAGLDITLPQ